MGAIAEAMLAYAQPLLEITDGSEKQMNRALQVCQTCWNLAIFSKEEREKTLREMRSIMESEGEDFEEFRTSILNPMIQRHEEMFPLLHQRVHVSSLGPALGGAARVEKYPGTDPYAPCPCNSGRKYKFCCRG